MSLHRDDPARATARYTRALQVRLTARDVATVDRLGECLQAKPSEVLRVLIRYAADHMAAVCGGPGGAP